MVWNQAAYAVLGGSGDPAPAGDELALLERWIGGPLPGAVREWYLLGGDRGVAVPADDDDPPVYLIDPDDDACATRSRYAATFSEYAFTAAWDATLWAGELSADFDHPLPSDALAALNLWLTALPTTHGWAMNQSCDAVYRFGGAAQVAVAVEGTTALWSAIAAPSTAMRDVLAKLIGATPDH